MFPGQTTAHEEERLYSMTNPDEVKIGISYTGPHIHFPLTTLQLQNLISAFKNKQVPVVTETMHIRRAFLLQYSVSLMYFAVLKNSFAYIHRHEFEVRKWLSSL